MPVDLTLISHHLCPYVQRAAISLHEKKVAFERRDIDLGNKPDWFLRLSPLGKTPVLLVGNKPIFESAVILEYLEDTQHAPLHPRDALERARHRGWIEFASSILNDIAGFYSAKTAQEFAEKATQLRRKFARLEPEIGTGPYFDGVAFSLVDASFAPVFRYFDTFDTIGDFGILTDLPTVKRWRQELANRPSVKAAVGADYPQRLQAFLHARASHISALLTAPVQT